jgi:hypothetical protein
MEQTDLDDPLATMSYSRMFPPKSERVSHLSHSNKPIQQSHKDVGPRIISHGENVKHLRGIYRTTNMTLEAELQLIIKVLAVSTTMLLNSLEIELIRPLMNKYASGFAIFNVTTLDPTDCLRTSVSAHIGGVPIVSQKPTRRGSTGMRNR